MDGSSHLNAAGERPLGWGLIGASRIAAEFVVPEIAAHPDSVVAGVFSTEPARGQAYAQQHGIPRVHATLDALLGDPDVDVVYVSTTNELHAEQVLAAAAAGKHVLCEKPLALTLADARRMVEACEEAGVALATNHHLRNAPAHRAVRDLIGAGSIGEPRFARIDFAGLLPAPARRWRLAGAGAGAVYDLTVHSVDLIRYLLGAEVREVVAMTARHGLARDGVEDGAMALLRLDDDVLVSLQDAFTVPGSGTGVEIDGSAGSIVTRGTLSQRPAGTVELIRDGRRSTVDVGPPTSLYAPVVDSLNAAARGRGKPICTGRDGMRSLEVALAVLAAAHEGRRVTLP